MGGGEGERVSGGYARLRVALDEAGYSESLPLQALPLVQHLYNDLEKTTRSVNKTLQQYAYYKQIAEELEAGVGPFKEENVRLIRENSHLRMEVVRSKEDFDDQLRGSRSRLRDLEDENTDLKLLINRFVEKVKKLEIESLVKTNRIAELQEKHLESVIIMPECSKKPKESRQILEIESFAPNACPHCVRLRNYVEFDPTTNPTAIDYLKLTDSRIEALQLQIRSLKSSEKDMTHLVSSMKCKIEDRDAEIEKLRKYVTVRVGSDNLANGMISKAGYLNGDTRDLELQLKSAQMQLDMIQRRNVNLEKKLKSSILQEHEDYMLGRKRTKAEKEFVKSLAELELEGYPTHDEMNLNEKLKYLELQLSNCCKEKAELKAALDECQNGRDKGGKSGGGGSKTKMLFSSSKNNLPEDKSRNKSRLEQHHDRALTSKDHIDGYHSDTQNEFRSDDADYLSTTDDDSEGGDGAFSGEDKHFDETDEEEPSQSPFLPGKSSSSQRSQGNSMSGIGSPKKKTSFQHGEERDTEGKSPRKSLSKESQQLRSTLKTKSSSTQELRKRVSKEDSSIRRRSSQSQPPPPSSSSTAATKKSIESMGAGKSSKLNLNKDSREKSDQNLISSSLMGFHSSGVSSSRATHPQTSQGGSKATTTSSKQQDEGSSKALSSLSGETSSKTRKRMEDRSKKRGERINAENEAPPKDLRHLKKGVASTRHKLMDYPRGPDPPYDPKEMNHIVHRQPKVHKEPLPVAPEGKPGSKAPKKQAEQENKAKSKVFPKSKDVRGPPADNNDVTEIYKNPQKSLQQSSKAGAPQPRIGMPTKRESVRGTESDERMQKLKAMHGASISSKTGQRERNEDRISEQSEEDGVVYEESIDAQMHSMDVDEVEGESFPDQGTKKLPAASSSHAFQPTKATKTQRQLTKQQSVIEDEVGRSSAWVTGQHGQGSRDEGREREPSASRGPSQVRQEFHDLNLAVRQNSQDRRSVQEALGNQHDGILLGRQKSKEDERRRDRSMEEEIEFAYGRGPIERQRGIPGGPDDPFGRETPLNVLFQASAGGMNSERPTRKDTHTVVKSSWDKQEEKKSDGGERGRRDPYAQGNDQLDRDKRGPSPFDGQKSKEKSLYDQRKSELERQASKEMYADSRQKAYDARMGEEFDSERGGRIHNKDTLYQQKHDDRRGPYDQEGPLGSHLQDQRSRVEKQKSFDAQKGMDQQKFYEQREQSPNDQQKLSDQRAALYERANPLLKQYHDEPRSPYDHQKPSGQRERGLYDQQKVSGSGGRAPYDRESSLGKRNAEERRGPSDQRGPYDRQNSLGRGASDEQRSSYNNQKPPDISKPFGKSNFDEHQGPYNQQKLPEQRQPYERQSSVATLQGDEQRNPYNQQNVSEKGNPYDQADPLSRRKFDEERGLLSRRDADQQQDPYQQQQQQNPMSTRNPYDQINPSYDEKRLGSTAFGRSLEREDGIRPSLTRTVLRSEENPSYSEMSTATSRENPRDRQWLTRDSNVDAFQREVERLREDLYKKEDELDRLTQDRQIMQSRISSLQSDLQMRRSEYPTGTQQIIKRLEEERDFLQNSLRQNQGRVRELERQVASQESAAHEARSLHNKLKEIEKLYDSVRSECKQLGGAKVDLDREIKKLRAELADCQADRQQWKNEAQKHRSSLEQTEMLLSETQKRSSQSQLIPQRENFEMAQRIRQQAAKEQELEREILHLKSSVKTLDCDKDEMRVELDRKDEKLARMSQDCEKHLSELSRLQLALKNAETQIGHSGETAKDFEREMGHMRRQTDTLKRDLEMMAKERDEAIRDCRRLAGAISKEEIERRSLNTELEKTSKEADDLRKQLQKYIDEVRRIEDLLLQKEDEMEALIEHYRSLTLEKSSLETQRTSLEREATSIREDVREAVDTNITLKTQLASQNALIKSYEEEIERLTSRVSTVENQLSNSSYKERSAEADVKATRDLIFNLETKMDKLKLQLANSESVKNKLEAENGEQKRHIELLEEQLEQEVEKQKKLEELIANVREKEFLVERTTQDLSMERNELAERLTSIQSRTEILNEEVSKFRLKSIELQNELDRTKRQLQSEKSERETAIAELRRVQEQLNTTSTNTLLNAALLGASGGSGGQGSDYSARYGLSTSGVQQQSGGSIPFSPMSDTYLHSPLGASTNRDQGGMDGSGTSSGGGVDPQT